VANYFVGDIQGCYDELRLLLSKVSFDKNTDHLWVAGDMVARGKQSLETVEYLMSLGSSAHIVLGNHDLHLLATYEGLKKAKPNDYLDEILNSPNVESIMNWLAKQPLLQKLPNEEVYMSHAGLSPQWSIHDAVAQANLAQKKLASNERKKWLSSMYGELPDKWTDAITEEEKFRYTINSLTRMRYCRLDGSLEFDCKLSPDEAPDTLKPWFNLSQNLSNTHWVFGHWASLMGNTTNKNVFALDTGCVWGQYLTLLKWDDKTFFTQNSINQ
jgi:bis(5'-nucleosyl)-tetraphosphatase (symmetrical)